MSEIHMVKVSQMMAIWVSDQLVRSETDQWKQLQLKMFSVIADGKTAEINFSQEELWLLHTVAKSSGRVGNETVGMLWLEAVAAGLVHFATEEQLGLLTLSNHSDYALTKEVLEKWQQHEQQRKG